MSDFHVIQLNFVLISKNWHWERGSRVVQQRICSELERLKSSSTGWLWEQPVSLTTRVHSRSRTPQNMGSRLTEPPRDTYLCQNLGINGTAKKWTVCHQMKHGSWVVPVACCLWGLILAAWIHLLVFHTKASRQPAQLCVTLRGLANGCTWSPGVLCCHGTTDLWDSQLVSPALLRNHLVLSQMNFQEYSFPGISCLPVSRPPFILWSWIAVSSILPSQIKAAKEIVHSTSWSTSYLLASWTTHEDCLYVLQATHTNIHLGFIVVC